MDRLKLFRVWDKEKNDWFKPTHRGQDGEISDILINLNGELIVRQNDRLIHESAFPNRFTLVQSVGSQDIKHRLIFEGDIISTRDFLGIIDIRQTFVVSWSSEIKRRKLSDPKTVGYELQGEDAMIIGNVFQNPELTINKDDYQY